MMTCGRAVLTTARCSLSGSGLVGFLQSENDQLDVVGGFSRLEKLAINSSGYQL